MSAFLTVGTGIVFFKLKNSRKTLFLQKRHYFLWISWKYFLFSFFDPSDIWVNRIQKLVRCFFWGLTLDLSKCKRLYIGKDLYYVTLTELLLSITYLTHKTLYKIEINYVFAIHTCKKVAIKFLCLKQVVCASQFFKTFFLQFFKT